jgi:rhodanese-related sulfurtransferase
MDYKTIDSATLKSWLEKDEAVLIDVREQGEYDEVNIPASTLVPLGKISIRALPSSDKKIVIHCLKGGRGQKACEALCAHSRELDLYNLAGGIEAWIDAGLPVHRNT